MPDELRIHLFGFPRIECGQEPVTFSRRKALALVAYLATTRQGHSRENLAALLWPEAPADKAYAYLRNLLWMLRRSKIDPWLEAGRHTIALTRTESFRTDVVELRECLSRSQSERRAGGGGGTHEGGVDELTKIVGAINGRFLEGFHIDDSEPFEQWQFSESEALRVDQADALDLIIQEFRQQGALKEAIRHARMLVAVDVLNEEHQRRLMELLASDGQRSEALRVYEACGSALQRELGLEPSDETEALAESLRMDRDDRAATIQSAPLLMGLPSYPTEFEGRHRELQRIRDLIEDGARLISLTGIGGVGKTRLAVEATAQSGELFPDGVAFVPLSSVHSVNMTVSVILDTLGRGPGIPLRPRGSAEQQVRGSLAEQLGCRKSLILLDEADHIGDGVSVIKALLETAPSIVLLVTTRRPLDIQGEWVIRVGGLSVESQDSPALPEQRRKAPAVQLFLKTARRASESFVVTSSVVEAAERICRFIAGHPLGIEMAARWARVLPAEEIAETIERDLELLRSEAELPTSRHRSLLQVYTAAWKTLSPRLQAVLVRLSVFQGGFSTEAAATVSGATPSDVAQLMDRGLIRRASTTRFAIHEALRQFAYGQRGRIKERIEPSKQLHMAFFLDLVERSERRLAGAEQADALRELADDWGNIRSAWHEALMTGDFDRIRRSARAVFFVNDIRSDFADATEMFGEASERVAEGQANCELRGLLLGLKAWFCRWSSPAIMRELFQQSMDLLEQAPFGSSHALISVLAGFTASWGESLARLETNGREAIRLFRESGDRWGEAVALESFASLRTTQGAPLTEIERLISDSLSLRQELGDTWGTSLLLLNLAQCRKAEGRFDEALSLVRESRNLRQRLGVDPLGAADCLVVESQILTAVGEYSIAASCARRASMEMSRLGVEIDDAWARLVEAEAHWGAQKPKAAVELWSVAYRTTQRLHADRYSSFLANRLSLAAIERGELVMAQAYARLSTEHAPEELWGWLARARLELAQNNAHEARIEVARSWQAALVSPPDQRFLQEILAAWSEVLIGLDDPAAAVRSTEDGLRQTTMSAYHREHLVKLRVRLRQALGDEAWEASAREAEACQAGAVKYWTDVAEEILACAELR